MALDKALQLASTGRFEDYRDIDAELTHVEGWSMAHSVLDNAARRKLLSEMCEQARKRHDENPPGP